MTLPVSPLKADTPDCAPPPVLVKAPRERMPEGTCDTHVHVFGPRARFPLDPGRGYTPHVCTLEQYQAVMRVLGIARAVLVQPSVYGTDNDALLDTMSEAGPGFRAVVVPRPGIEDAALHAMNALGVRGVRLNLVNPQVLRVEDAVTLSGRIAPLDWHLQVQLDLAHTGVAGLLELVERVRIPIVIDHMGRVDPSNVPRQLVDLVRSGRCWVKLSAPYRVSKTPPPHADLDALVRMLVAANPERLLWGSDWPHTEQAIATPHVADLADQLFAWLPDEALRRRVCVENPARLYGF